MKVVTKLTTMLSLSICSLQIMQTVSSRHIMKVVIVQCDKCEGHIHSPFTISWTCRLLNNEFFPVLMTIYPFALKENILTLVLKNKTNLK